MYMPTFTGTVPNRLVHEDICYYGASQQLLRLNVLDGLIERPRNTQLSLSTCLLGSVR